MQNPSKRLLGYLTLFLSLSVAYGASIDVPSGTPLQSLNALTGATQIFAVGTSGTDFAVSSSGSTHTLNLPDAGASARGLVTTGTQTLAGAKTFSTSINAASLSINGAVTDAVFYRTCTLTSAAAVTPINCLADADVPAGKKAYITHWHASVSGGTLWALVTSCVIEDTAGVDYISLPVAILAASVTISDGTALVAPASAYALGTGGTIAKGIQVSCNSNGTGSSLVFVLSGVIK